ncbi:MAG: bifunctional folylpolyglutamate synthase/dihydrofolate synthase [Spirochaetae bacterium HGW-Spirochaetae-1]|jgi:dihydrofolate synthase/folylpolyglutamate synthase|nr:MAG: bifunctional folylpolyglutamate synthase/dihydrofolate synthase [Spirochaetae bacterium HGW-Spirochaetae-1]
MTTDILRELINNEKQTRYTGYSLESIILLLDKLGNPHRKIKCIHIAGTNGKGSTAWFLNTIFQAAGYKTGLYTSPHLHSVNERMLVDNEPIDDEVLGNYLTKIREVMNSFPTITPTYFDVLTAAAFFFFHESSVDIAIIETGLGGIKDSTNIIIPLCSIITDISLDHTSILGETIDKIAAEKAGIIKKNIPVITSNHDPEIRDILLRESKSMGSRLLTLGEDFRCARIPSMPHHVCFNYDFNYSNEEIHLQNVNLQSPVHEQMRNASLALTAAIMLMPVFKKLSLETMRMAVSDTQVPGRFFIIQETPPVIFDPAHNPSAIRALIETIRVKYMLGRIYAIITVMKDKDYEDIFNLLEGSSIPILYYYGPGDDNRSYDPEIEGHPRFHSISRDEHQLLKNITGLPVDNRVLLFTGSFRIYDTALSITEKLISSL